MRFLRTAPTTRLLVAIAAVVMGAATVTAIAIAAAGGGPVPPRTTLADALHRALHAPAVAGVSARVTFTNNLIGSAVLQGVDPLLSGASGRLWAADGRVRIELQGDNGDAQIMLGPGSFWAYDPVSNTVFQGSLPAPHSTGSHTGRSAATPTVARIQSYLTRLAGRLSFSSATPTDFGGQPAYSVRITPVGDSGLLAGVRLGWDAAHGVPLDFAVYAKGVSGPVLELRMTDISYGPLARSDYAISPPSGATVVRVGTASATASAPTPAGAEITGPAAVASHLRFQLDAPSSLASMSRTKVSLIGSGGSSGALVRYGHGLGGIVVIERATGAGAGGGGAGAIGALMGNMLLPTAQVNGATATELPTALGTVLMFTRNGVDYTLAGSVVPSVAIAAARGL